MKHGQNHIKTIVYLNVSALRTTTGKSVFHHNQCNSIEGFNINRICVYSRNTHAAPLVVHIIRILGNTHEIVSFKT